MKSLKNPFKNLMLDEEEKEIEKAVESGRVRSIPNLKREIKRYRQAAKYTLDKTKNINIRISGRDLLQLKAKSIEEGIPYQTLAGSIIHKYTTLSTRRVE